VAGGEAPTPEAAEAGPIPLLEGLCQMIGAGGVSIIHILER